MALGLPKYRAFFAEVAARHQTTVDVVIEVFNVFWKLTSAESKELKSELGIFSKTVSGFRLFDNRIRDVLNKIVLGKKANVKKRKSSKPKSKKARKSKNKKSKKKSKAVSLVGA